MPSPYASVFHPGLFSGQVAIVTGGGSGAARAGMLNFTETAAFNGFHLASKPKVLD